MRRITRDQAKIFKMIGKKIKRTHNGYYELEVREKYGYRS